MADLKGFIPGCLVMQSLQADISNICSADALRNSVTLQPREVIGRSLVRLITIYAARQLGLSPKSYQHNSQGPGSRKFAGTLISQCVLKVLQRLDWGDHGGKMKRGLAWSKTRAL